MTIVHFGLDFLRNVHDPAVCAGEPCPSHSPTDHHMLGWDLGIEIDDQGVPSPPPRFAGVPIIMRVCPHELLHPDPDSLDYFVKEGLLEPGDHLGVCDGCCVPRPPAFGE